MYAAAATCGPLSDSPAVTVAVFITPQVPHPVMAPVLPVLGLVWNTLKPGEAPSVTPVSRTPFLHIWPHAPRLVQRHGRALSGGHMESWVQSAVSGHRLQLA